MNLFGGLSELGLGNITTDNLYDEKKTTEKKMNEKQKEIEITEESCLYAKQYECPVCGNKFSQSAVRTGHLRMLGQDRDLKPRYVAIDPAKYDIVHCNQCGYAVLKRYYGPLAGAHKKLLQENISASYRPMRPSSVLMNYDDAILKYRLALANAVVRKAKSSEKALICLRTAWVLRGKREEIQENINKGVYSGDADLVALREDECNQCYRNEVDFLKNAMEGFLKARKEEQFPIAGMNQVTLDYLLAVLCGRFGKRDDAYRLLQGIVTMKTAGEAQKEKARELIQELRTKETLIW